MSLIVVAGPPGAGRSPEATCVQRVATRRGHGFSDEDATRHMHRQFVSAVVDLDQRCVIDEGLGIAAVSELILERRALGQLVHHVRAQIRESVDETRQD